MQLEVNENHKKIRFGGKLNPLQRIKITVAGVVIAITMLSGISTQAVEAKSDSNSIVWTIDGQDVKVPASVSGTLEAKLGKSHDESISSAELDNIKTLIVNLDDDEQSLEFLSYFSNLESLSIVSPSYITLKAKELEKGIKPIPLKSLMIYGNTTLEPGCEETLNKLEKLCIIGGYNYDIDFSKLTNLKTLDLSGSDPYDIAIYLNSEEYTALVSNGVDVVFDDDEEAKDKYLRAAKKLAIMIEELNIPTDATEDQKLDAIIVYVLEHLEYDKKVSALITDGEPHEEQTEKFYEGGRLYGALEKDTAICGNYAALTEALMDRLCAPQRSHILESTNHAWNIVKINGEPYFVDVTWLESQTRDISKQEESYDENGHKIISYIYDTEGAIETIKKGKGHELHWYRENPEAGHISSIDKHNSHEASYIPDYMIMEENNYEETPRETEAIDNAEEIGDKKVKIKIGTKEIVIGVGVLLGILGAASGAFFAVRRKRAADRRRRLMFPTYYEDFSTQDTPKRY